MADAVCEHDEAGAPVSHRNDPALPPHVVVRECCVCGAAYEWDTELGEVV